MTERLDLLIGKPVTGEDEHIATFTRFTLPFAFKVEFCSETAAQSGLYYQSQNKNEIGFIKRKKYFTQETADTLYENGQWLFVCDTWNETAWGKAEVPVTFKNRDFKIGMLPPQIVLFNLPEIEAQTEHSVLQTGFLYVDVYFAPNQTQPPQLDDLLVLNEFFRYFGIPYDDHAQMFKTMFSKVPVYPIGAANIASLGSLTCYFERWAALLEIPLKHNGRFYSFFPDSWAQNAKAWMYNTLTDKAATHWQIYADNRCYVWTVVFLKNREGGASLKTEFEPEKATLQARDYGHWIKLLNIDCPPFDGGAQKYKTERDTHLSVSEFERDWADQRTYKRWEHAGTWFGFCYHGAAILAPPVTYVFSPAASYYFDTNLLLLYIRMTLFRFSSELSKTIPAIVDKTDERTRNKLRNLRGLFSRFTILYRFPKLSNQQQSIEMYEINSRAFENDCFFNEIQKEVDNTHEFLELLEGQRLASDANRLANYGIPLAVGGLFVALMSMSNLKVISCIFEFNKCGLNWDLLIQAFSVSIVVFFIWKRMKKNRIGN